MINSISQPTSTQNQLAFKAVTVKIPPNPPKTFMSSVIKTLTDKGFNLKGGAKASSGEGDEFLKVLLPDHKNSTITLTGNPNAENNATKTLTSAGFEIVD